MNNCRGSVEAAPKRSVSRAKDREPERLGAPAGRSRTISVLLADDHPVLRDGCRHLLDATPDIRVVAEADDGASACARYAEHLPDVVLLDLGMPGPGGLDAIGRLKACDPNARILVFSAQDQETLVRHVLKAGAAGFLSKQCGVEEMVNAVRQVANGKTVLSSRHLLDMALHRASEDPIGTLSTREFQLFLLAAEGCSVADIARLLSISPKTAGVHHANILRKLGLRNDAQLARLAISRNMVGLG